MSAKNTDELAIRCQIMWSRIEPFLKAKITAFLREPMKQHCFSDLDFLKDKSICLLRAYET